MNDTEIYRGLGGKHEHLMIHDDSIKGTVTTMIAFWDRESSKKPSEFPAVKTQLKGFCWCSARFTPPKFNSSPLKNGWLELPSPFRNGHFWLLALVAFGAEATLEIPQEPVSGGWAPMTGRKQLGSPPIF